MTSPRPLLLARLLAIGTTFTAACGGIETGSTGEQTGSAGGGAGQGGGAAAGSSGGSGQAGAPSQGGAAGASGQGGAASGQGGSIGVAGQAGQGGAAGAVVAGAGGAAGSEALPACKLPPPCTNPQGVCYERGDEEACAPADSPGAWVRLGCELSPDEGVYAQEIGPQCCYQRFCGEGRPLYVDGLRTRAASRRRGDWG